MGNILSRRQETPSLTDEVMNRIHLLEQRADLNNDGVITKEEYQQFSAMQSLEKDRKINKLRERLAKEEDKVKELHRHYQELQAKHQALLDYLADENKADIAQSTQLSTKAIDAFVDDLLADPKINIYWLHDSIERPLYRNMLIMMLSILQKTLNSASLNVIGHEFRTSMQPTLDSQILEAQHD